MFLLDSLMISGIRWAIETVVTAAEAEMNDDTALREQLLAAEMRRELGEISDDEFVAIEAALLARIREIKDRREGGGGPLAFGAAEPLEGSAENRFHIEASVSGDFHDPAAAPHTTIVETSSEHGEQIAVLDMEPGEPQPLPEPGLPLLPLPRARRSARTASSSRPRRRTAPRRRS